MNDSSFLSTSSKYKKRKPIFPKNQHSPVAKLTEHLSKSSSQLLLPNRNSSPALTPSNSRVITRPVDTRVHALKIEPPTSTLRISYSQPKMVAASNHIIYNTRPVTPLPSPGPILAQRSLRYQQPMHTVQFQPAQPIFYQTMQSSSSLRRSSHHLYQTQPISMARVDRKIRAETKENQENNGNSAITLKPTVIAIQRVVKEVDSNIVQKQITYLSKEEGECAPPTVVVTPPPAAHSFSQSSFPPKHSAALPVGDGAQLSKLSQINSLLTENYNLLYNQFFNLKRDIREEEVVEERAFLQRSVNHIESIFSLQTSHALSQIEEVYQNAKPHLKKSFKGRSEIKAKNIFA